MRVESFSDRNSDRAAGSRYLQQRFASRRPILGSPSPKYKRFIQERIEKFDSFVARLSRSYHRCATAHVARPIRSILDSARNDKLDAASRCSPK
jgi:hypothetical protein